jgi:SulP family sulfate permease
MAPIAQPETADKSRASRLVAEFQPASLLPNITAGLVIAIIEVVFAVSMAALIFGGELATFVSSGIGLMLFGTVVIVAIMALLSSSSHVVGMVQDGPAVILSLIAAAIVATIPAGATPEETFLTVVAAIALSALLTGLFFLALGFFRSGGLVRFLPYPVIGGFLAGTGWLLALGSIAVMTDLSTGLSQIVLLLQPEVLVRWLPGLVFAILLMAALKRFSSALIMPGLILGGIALFYLVAWSGDSTVAELSAQGWLLGPFPEGGLYQPLLPSDLAQVSWPTILGQVGNVATILVISVIGLLLNASGLELLFQKDMDFNRELRAAGVANIFSGIGGSTVGFHGLGISTLGFRVKGTGRLTAVIVAIVCALALFAGGSLLSLFPKLILGGLLMYLGLSFLVEWVYEAWFKLPRLDYFVVILILVTIAAFGFLQGVAIGLVTAVIFFVVNYSRTNVVKYALSGANAKSRVTRVAHQQRLLRELGEQLYILHLQGFIFFGTANNLLERVRSRVADPERPTPRFILLEFRQVSGVDTTAMLSFNKMRQLAESSGMSLVFADISPATQQQFEAGGFVDTEEGPVHIFPDVDHALEWCENRLLAGEGLAAGMKDETIEDHLGALLPEGADVNVLIAYMEPRELAAGEYLMRQGDPPDDLYFIENGQVTAQREIPDHDPIRLETMRGGHMLGEIGFYLGEERTASVVADEPTTVYRLTKPALERMELDHTKSALVFQDFIIEQLAERVSHMVGTIDALQR